MMINFCQSCVVVVFLGFVVCSFFGGFFLISCLSLKTFHIAHNCVEHSPQKKYEEKMKIKSFEATFELQKLTLFSAVSPSVPTKRVGDKKIEIKIQCINQRCAPYFSMLFTFCLLIKLDLINHSTQFSEVYCDWFCN